MYLTIVWPIYTARAPRPLSPRLAAAAKLLFPPFVPHFLLGGTKKEGWRKEEEGDEEGEEEGEPSVAAARGVGSSRPGKLGREGGREGGEGE